MKLFTNYSVHEKFIIEDRASRLDALESIIRDWKKGRVELEPGQIVRMQERFIDLDISKFSVYGKYKWNKILKRHHALIKRLGKMEEEKNDRIKNN